MEEEVEPAAHSMRASSPTVRFLGFLTQPDTDSNPFELDESDVIWSPYNNNNNNNISSPPDSPNHTNHFTTDSMSPALSSTPSPTTPQIHHSFRSEKFFGLSAALSDDHRPLVQRKPSLNHSLSASSAAARMIPPVSYPRSNGGGSGSDGYKSSGSFSGKFHQSAPVNVPVWPAANKFNGSETARLGFFEEVEEEEFEEEMLPPHEIVARSHSTTFSVFEGVGRTLKGRDLRRVRNAVWQKTGFLD